MTVTNTPSGGRLSANAPKPVQRAGRESPIPLREELPDGMVWEEPKVKPRGREGLRTALAPHLEQLRHHPGKAARLRTFASKTAASGARKKLSDDLAGEGFEFYAARDEFGPGSILWGRYQP